MDFSFLLTQLLNIFLGAVFPIALILVLISHFGGMRDLENRAADLETKLMLEN